MITGKIGKDFFFSRGGKKKEKGGKQDEKSEGKKVGKSFETRKKRINFEQRIERKETTF